jgi:hypothetical protein
MLGDEGSSAGGGKRTSVVYEEGNGVNEAEKGPPPPRLPEIGSLAARDEKSGGGAGAGAFGGEDMFASIR